MDEKKYVPGVAGTIVNTHKCALPNIRRVINTQSSMRRFRAFNSPFIARHDSRSVLKQWEP